MPRLRPFAALVALAPLAAGAQMTTVDEGAFTVNRGGARVGREEFRIVRQPGPGGTDAYVARATSTLGGRRLSPALQTDGAGLPERYQLEVRRGDAVEQRVLAQAAGTHLRSQVQLDGGEAAREYLLEPGAVLVDDDLFHQYYFVVRQAGSGGAAVRVPVVAPRRAAQAPMWLTLDGTERVTVGGRPVDARHFVLTDRAGGRREVWADAQGRVLRVAIPNEGVDAVRDEPPR